jgi:hypothetical protein
VFFVGLGCRIQPQKFRGRIDVGLVVDRCLLISGTIPLLACYANDDITGFMNAIQLRCIYEDLYMMGYEDICGGSRRYEATYVIQSQTLRRRPTRPVSEKSEAFYLISNIHTSRLLHFWAIRMNSVDRARAKRNQGITDFKRFLFRDFCTFRLRSRLLLSVEQPRPVPSLHPE